MPCLARKNAKIPEVVKVNNYQDFETFFKIDPTLTKCQFLLGKSLRQQFTSISHTNTIKLYYASCNFHKLTKQKCHSTHLEVFHKSENFTA
jgi:hypothetical protein